ncbi:YgaP family membrane protein [Flavobacterium restrictum]|uniref:DUF2892 domain-containing protein n=1 Tax=Flavobacterium restrictum TaxID=2594428 RepID=A0A553E041_9FLAO|nr:DUF2892 domain-containing protein [Flavobacterium restrictum]TRX38380.1 DUF2892 domain-containing protein [Flavobacterium restrictum]
MDKLIRVLIALILAFLFFTNTVTGSISILLLVLAFIFLATSFIGFCPLYVPFGISTQKKQ